MQAPRFWRTKTQRYRLTGTRYNNGEVQVVNRPSISTDITSTNVEKATVSAQAKTKQPAA